MITNPKIIKSRFEKSLKTYKQNAIVQKAMADDLTSEILKIKKNFGNILELGCGVGILTEILSKNIHYEKFCTNDLTEKAELYVKKYIQDTVFYSGNALKIKPDCKFDLVVSNAMFQWINLPEIKKKCKLLLNSKGILAFSTFGTDNYKEIKNLTGLSLSYKSIDEISDIFSDDFDILYSNEKNLVLNFNTPLELLAHMKNTGVNSLSEKSWTVKDIKEFCDNYSKKYERVSLTYSPMIFVMRLK